ncbi:MAG: hypothetical protein F4018_11195 [Acidobacteria bacterium]|nr:hypothetical protein [Gammaproteobacteria bacterium]MYK88843.1 hypothetical protein [Acidobacteriota bacterium]
MPAACNIRLAVAADVDSGISGTWTNVAGAPSGCVFGPEIEFQFKQSTWDHFRSYGRYPNTQLSDDSFIAYDLTPGVSYDFRTGANGAVSVHGRDSHEDGTVTLTSVSESDEFGASPVSDSFASGGNGTLFTGWDVDELTIPAGIGTHDAGVVQRRKQNADETWPAWPTGHVITDTTARSHTFTGLADGTWQVRVRARTANTEDHDNDANTPDQTVHRLGFTSEIHTVTLDAAYTAVPGPPTGATIARASAR